MTSSALQEIGELWSEPACRAYVDSATYGLPPRATVEAVRKALAAWETGSADWIRDWDAPAEEARSLAGELLGCPAEEVALLPAASIGVGMIASSLGPGDEVVVPDDEFTSLLYPLLVAKEARGYALRRVPFEAVADSVGERTTLVATSYVRSNGGGRQDLAAVLEAARRRGAAVLLDATHAAGVLRLDAAADGVDYLVSAAYKHLLCPRGVAFLRVAPERRASLHPFAAGWRAAGDPYAHYYGGGLEDLASDGRRFDVSLAWHAWVGARESLRVLASVDGAAREAWTVGLATDLAERLGLEPTGSSILGIPVRESLDAVVQRLEEASVVASLRAGHVRVSFHLYNDADDVEVVGAALEPIVAA